jgi:outer membrane protein TolC
MKDCVVVLLVLAGWTSNLYSAFPDSSALSLADALQMAEKHNFDARLAETDVELSQADMNKTNSLFLPQITLSETYVTTNDPLNVFGIKLKQEIVSAADFNPDLLNDPKNIKNFSTKIDIQQPLVNIDGIYGRSSAALALKAAKAKQKRITAYIQYEVKKQYYMLVLAKASYAVIEKSLSAVKEYRDQAKNYYEQGLIHRSDLLMAEVQLLDMESKKIEAANQIKDASDRLHLLTGLTSATTLTPSDSLTIPQSEASFPNIESANEKRSDMKAMRFGISAIEKIHTMNLLRIAPSVNAFGSYEMNEDKIFGSKGKNWMVGIVLKWELFKGWDHFGDIQKSSAQLRSAKIGYEKAKQNNQNEMQSAVRNLNVMRKKTELTGESVKQAEESLRIMTDRYSKGLEKTSDQLMSEAMYSNARLGHLQALFAYHVNLFTLQLLFEDNSEK